MKWGTRLNRGTEIRQIWNPKANKKERTRFVLLYRQLSLQLIINNAISAAYFFSSMSAWRRVYTVCSLIAVPNDLIIVRNERSLSETIASRITLPAATRAILCALSTRDICKLWIAICLREGGWSHAPLRLTVFRTGVRFQLNVLRMTMKFWSRLNFDNLLRIIRYSDTYSFDTSITKTQ